MTRKICHFGAVRKKITKDAHSCLFNSDFAAISAEFTKIAEDMIRENNLNQLEGPGKLAEFVSVLLFKVVRKATKKEK